MRAMAAFDRSVREATTLEPSLVHLVKQRASQLNGCAYASTCTPRSRADGESTPAAASRGLRCVLSDLTRHIAREV